MVRIPKIVLQEVEEWLGKLLWDTELGNCRGCGGTGSKDGHRSDECPIKALLDGLRKAIAGGYDGELPGGAEDAGTES